MTSYNGALRFDAGGQAIGAGQFAISIAGTMSVSSARLSGGTLSGYTGASGTITAEVWRDDGRFMVPVWSTITDWEPGETLTLWGWTAGVSQSTWVAEADLPTPVEMQVSGIGVLYFA